MLDIHSTPNVDLGQLQSLNPIDINSVGLDFDLANTTISSAAAAAPVVDLSSFASGRLPDGLSDGDRIQRAASDDVVLRGGKGDDILYGTAGHHLLKGGAGDDYLEALSGEDWLIGGRGSDILVDSVGGSVLTGGSGADQFWVERWAAPDAASIITDFNVGKDQIKVGRLGATFDQLQLKDDLLGVVISDQGHEIARLLGVRSDQLSAYDFVFGDPALAEQLQSTLERERQAFGAPGATAAKITPDGFTWKGASGLADINTQMPMQPDDIVSIGSDTKAFTGVTTLKLQEKGILDLDDTLGEWAPDIAENIPDGVSITLRQLLNGTSGIVDYANSPRLQQEFIQDPFKPRAPEELVSWIYGEPRSQEWIYPNTGVAIVGIVIERATGKPLAEVMREEVLDPLGLDQTFYDGVDDVVGNRARGYQDVFALDGSLIQDGSLNDFLTDLDMSVWGGTGALLSTAQDMAQFSQALFSGALLSSESLEELLDNFVPLVPELAWGLGFEQGETPWGDFWGKGGNSWSFTSQTAYLGNHGMTTATIFNRDYSLGAGLGNPETPPPFFNLTEALFEDVLGEPPQVPQA